MNKTELFIMNFYQSIKVNSPAQLSISNISDHLGLSVIYWDRPSAATELNNEYKILINKNLVVQVQWQEFGHEMGHYLGDGNRSIVHKYYVDYCESKADYFAYHFCVPTFMLRKLKGVTVYDVMNLFNVEFDFALRRLEMYKNNIIVAAESKTVYR